ncbi:flagellar basal-body rod modification protein FlgD [Planomicrobium stackebrandtii]|uniref:Flagellar basal-body rod modification protein FlgD n=1 Tax=Planomicrobium stackebrandtii TaxID=253160 RepID=A0ABU0H1M2_9BACL|nr:flagellar hook assembly protein FlgD [Planomicrobium stackebrandtii]MDQ0430675.1 flagellar basal-body rod modification protein FlgD [Planomicrobium stackebrandtii]
MNISTATTGTAAAAPAAPAAKTEATNALGQDAFLKILVTQMKHQDPMEPLKDTEFIGQMAQFTSLEQLTNLNKTMTQFVSNQGSSSLADYAHLIGTSVKWESETGSGEGIVKALSSKNGELLAELEGSDVKVPIESIQRIEKQTAATIDQEIV